MGAATDSRASLGGEWAVIVSPNPIHDTGGGQRSAQIALELLSRGWDVAFVSHGEVTETVDLGLHFDDPGLATFTLAEFTRSLAGDAFDSWTARGRGLFLTQVPIEESIQFAAELQDDAATVFDCVDLWDSELGHGWYRRRVEKRLAKRVEYLVASAPELVRRLHRLAGPDVRLVPNAFNARVFDRSKEYERPRDLPSPGPVVLYVGALWGGWLDWGLVADAARTYADAEFVFVGDYRGEGGELPENCHFLGLKPQADLPGYLAHADVAWLPWIEAAITRATSPLKVYEYLAMGLMVVGPDIEPIRELAGVFVPSDSRSLIDVLGDRLRRGADPGTLADMRSFSRDHSWTSRVDELLSWVADPSNARRRRGFLGRFRR